MPDHNLLWCVVRVVDYRIAFLEWPDVYGPLSEATWVTSDREEAYRAAREQRGLLLRCDGCPDEDTIKYFKQALAVLADAHTDASA